MRCLVTGATGHLGSHLVRLLVREGHEVDVLVRRTSALWRLGDAAGRIRLVHGSLADLTTARNDIHAAAPEVVFHLAWQGVSRDQREEAEQILTNVTGSLNLLEWVIAAGCRCFVGVGSQAEYGPYDLPLHEDLPPRPTTAYGTAKLCTGWLARKLCEIHDVRCVWLRLLATYGPADDERHLIPTVIRELLARRRPALTAGQQRWDYLYVEDAADAIYRAACTADAQGFYNLASGAAYSVREVSERIRDLIDPALPLGLGEVPYPPQQLMRLEADIGRLATTGFRTKVSLDEGLRRTVSWYRDHPRQPGA
jgi:nucleoside-diphosphate-sugar epimerase